MVHSAGDSRPEAADQPWWQAATVLFFGGLYIACSASLIAFNKYLVDEDRFPFAVVLVFLHMFFSSIYAFTLRLVAPSFFPSMTNPETRANIGAGFICKNIVPIAI